MEHFDLLIVGAGAAGMGAAIAAWEAGCRSILLADQRSELGGILPQCIHHGFGQTTFGRELTGPEYAKKMAGRLLETDVQIALETSVCSISPQKTAVLSSRAGLRQISFMQLILASGCRETPVGALPIAGTRPSGIFTAGQAQELINLHHRDLGSNVLILGSGDLGMIMARRFSLEGKRVIAVIEKKMHYTGLTRNYQRCLQAHHIPLICSATVTEILGKDRISGVTVDYLDTGTREKIPCDTLIIAVGLIPNRELVFGLETFDWLHFCGNCRTIHSIVDSAAAEGTKVGAAIQEAFKQ